MSDADAKRFPLRAALIWHGMTLSVWLRLLARNRFAVSPTRLPPAFAITGFSVFNSAARLVSEMLYRRRAERTEVEHAPLFVVGHWRTGTTLLHELLVQDDQFGFPTTYQCMAPHHFLHTERFVSRWFRFLLADQRPMDSMPLGWGKPQEEEFAVCNLGAPSPYVCWAFPRRIIGLPDGVDLEELSESEVKKWKEVYLWFLRRLTLNDPRRLVLKSPPQTARIKTLLEMFPESQFVHIVRSPFETVPSMLRMWKRMAHVLGLQTGLRPDLESQVFETYARMYRRFERDRALLSPAQLCDVKYEDLVADPLGQMERIYQSLGLGDFARVRSKVAEYLAASKDYRANKHELSEELRRRIAEHWREYIRRYGYEREAAS